MRYFILVSLIVLIILSVIYLQYFSYNSISISSIEKNPQSYNSVRVELRGLVIENTGLMFGPKYDLVETYSFQNLKYASRIALGLKAGPPIDLSKYVSYSFDGRNYTQISYRPVIVTGVVKYLGKVTDVPSFYLDVKDVKIDLD